MKRHAVNTQQPINRAHPLARGLTAWWLTLPRWYGGQYWYDLCGLNPGTLTNMGAGGGGWKATTRPGGYGHVKVDATNDYVVTGNLTRTTTYSVTGWIYSGGSQGISARALETGWNLWFFIGSNNPGANWQVYLDSAPALNGGTIPTNGWTHIAVVCSASASILYENGVQTATAGAVVYTARSIPLYMGRAYSGASNYWNGAFDDVRIYNRALSAAEVFALYNESRLGYPGLLNRWEWPIAGEAVAAYPAAYTRHIGMGIGQNAFVRHIGMGIG